MYMCSFNLGVSTLTFTMKELMVKILIFIQMVYLKALLKIRHLWQIEMVIYLHRCLICEVSLLEYAFRLETSGGLQ